MRHGRQELKRGGGGCLMGQPSGRQRAGDSGYQGPRQVARAPRRPRCAGKTAGSWAARLAQKEEQAAAGRDGRGCRAMATD